MTAPGPQPRNPLVDQTLRTDAPAEEGVDLAEDGEDLELDPEEKPNRAQRAIEEPPSPNADDR